MGSSFTEGWRFHIYNSGDYEGMNIVADNKDKVTWLASVWTQEKGRRIASTTSDGHTSTITYLTESQYWD
jgi:hypothetical protein